MPILSYLILASSNTILFIIMLVYAANCHFEKTDRHVSTAIFVVRFIILMASV